MSTTFVAEVSSNHQQDMDRCLKFIDTAAEIGCQAVKFQLFRVESLFSPEAITYQLDQQANSLADRKRWELPLEFLPLIAEHCRANGIAFACTPFYLEAVRALYPYVDFYKVASYELLWDGLLTACAETGKPVVLSTGMAALDEIEHAVQTLHDADCEDLTLLHCVSSYPTPVGECNLAAIEALRNAFDCPVGWSDHSVSPAVLYRAVHRWSAAMVEFHLDLDGTGGEYEYGHCWLPDQAVSVIAVIRQGFETDGDGVKVPVPSELPDREWRADPSDGLRPLLSKRRELRDGTIVDGV